MDIDKYKDLEEQIAKLEKKERNLMDHFWELQNKKKKYKRAISLTESEDKKKKWENILSRIDQEMKKTNCEMLKISEKINKIESEIEKCKGGNKGL